MGLARRLAPRFVGHAREGGLSGALFPCRLSKTCILLVLPHLDHRRHLQPATSNPRAAAAIHFIDTCSLLKYLRSVQQPFLSCIQFFTLVRNNHLVGPCPVKIILD